MTKRDINFEVYYKNNDNINFNHNPTIVNLELWGNFYNITYAKPAVIDPYDVMRSIEYREANITNLVDNNIAQLDVMTQNEVFLNPQQFNTFYRFTIDKIKEKEGLVRCTLFEKKVHGWELLKRIKEDVNKRRDAQMKKTNDAVQKARKDAEAMVKQQQQMKRDAGRRLRNNERQLQEKGFSFYTPPPVIDYEKITQDKSDTFFAEEDLTRFTDPEAAKAMARNEFRQKVTDRNNVFGYATSDAADYYDDKELAIEAKAPVKEFASHKSKVKKLMNKEYIEEYRIKCQIQ